MWVIYHKEMRKVVGLSAHSDLELDKNFALEEVVRGQGNAENLHQYDALQVSDRTQASALLSGRPVSSPAAVVTTAKAVNVRMHPPVPKRWMRLYAWVLMASD